MAHAAPLRCRLAGERREQQVVVLAVVHRDAHAVLVDAHDAAAGEQAVGELARLVGGHEEEAAVRRKRRVAERAQLAGETLALLERRREVRRRRERSERERSGERRHGRGRLPRVELGRGLGRRERVADACAGERERLRERAQHDHAVVDQPDGAVGAAELPVRLVDDERPRVGQRVERAGRVVRPAAEREHRVVVADRCARELGGDAIERIRRLVGDRDDVAGAGERARDEQDQVVGARAEHDVLRRDAGVRRRSRR